jgi:GntR family transcriptional repressor for pyruvate dehydrogenase complex
LKDDYKILIAPVKNRRTFEKVSDRLKELIFDGTFKPGQQLPSENALAQLFQVGRQSVREALRVLEISGFISTKPGIKGGAVIEGTVLSKLSNLFLDAFKFHRASLEDCLMTRKLVEVAMIELVLENADQHDIESLRKNTEQAKAKLDMGTPAFKENLDFHKLLAKASKNYVFTIMMELLLSVYADFRIKAGSVAFRQSIDMINSHEALTNAIAGKKREEAFKLLKKDLALGGEILMGSRLADGALNISDKADSTVSKKKPGKKRRK